ncbi:nucleotide pyrophosphohydrolase [Clostridium botulinum]|nr:nucleotide pyrophosphohydrolase [Clostridium botulinum]NFA13574.1 nucleotide pyrophosphohydrolase [Clostridium botulinum]NFA19686.1 nucleotide pyrophosphohydrolase [Clostridium botulinum]NFA39623.1 nucleotide pyrophosphohydrolase [Clostridium botulinum]NFA55825.1 nucleotide pyrophosphohydrolase [Clostridium botulinum]
MHLMILDKEETLPEELLKLQEEFKEVSKAIIANDKENTTEEILDNIQVLIGMLDTKVKTENMDLEKELNRHNRKLLGRGWKSKGKINIKINS